MRVAVVIPTYNEAANIRRLIPEVLSQGEEFEVYVVDDSSPDGTAEVVEELSRAYRGRVNLIIQEKKSGLGLAYIRGFTHVLSVVPGYERIVQMDGDFSHDPAYLRELVLATQGKDISIGSRYIAGGKVLKWSPKRLLLSRAANLFVRFWLGLPVKDSTSGFRCFRSSVLRGIKFGQLRSKGYLFQVELLVSCLLHGHTFLELPFSFAERKEGTTKLGLQEIEEAALGVLRLRFFINPKALLAQKTWER